ncbi:MAG: single-stranded-DNA-specific exonuclease RecJ [Cyclobacteriaceae bacterium]
MEKQWKYQTSPDPDILEELSQSLNINPPLTSILLQRRITSFDQAKTFFRPKLEQLHDPFLMKDMDKAVNRLSEAISGNEKILVYGDYDVDGTTSVSVMYSFLQQLTNQVTYYIPDRYTEGYGLSKQGVEFAAAQDFSLLITLDCGIKAFENAAYAKELGLDLIICDHHLPGDELPVATAVLDPKRNDCDYPYKELSGCGVGFKLIHGFCLQNTIDLNLIYQYLDLVCVSIASDIVPITGENRVLAFYGLQKLNSSPSPGLKALKKVAGLSSNISISDVVFYLGPRINAAGRLRHARESVKLLICEDQSELEAFAENLDSVNIDRRTFDSQTTDEALEMISNSEKLLSAKSTVVFKEDWHKGVIGIVASRLTENYYRPTIVLTQSNGKATGSARSVEGFDIYGAICECHELLEQYGGHTHAAGLTMQTDNVPAFINKFEEVVAKTITEDQLKPTLHIDLEVDFSFANFKTLSIINQMAPFGPHNMQPVFSSSQVYVKGVPRLLKEKHLKLKVYQKEFNQTFDAIGFGLGPSMDWLDPDKPIQIAYTIDINEYRGNKTLQLVLKDIKQHAT